MIKVKAAQTTSGYIVNSYFYDTLIDLWEESQVELIRTNEHWVYGLDQIWKTIQPQNNWYAFKKRLFAELTLHPEIIRNAENTKKCIGYIELSSKLTDFINPKVILITVSKREEIKRIKVVVVAILFTLN